MPADARGGSVTIKRGVVRRGSEWCGCGVWRADRGRVCYNGPMTKRTPHRASEEALRLAMSSLPPDPVHARTMSLANQIMDEDREVLRVLADVMERRKGAPRTLAKS